MVVWFIDHGYQQRPPAPPLTGSPQFKAETEEIYRFKKIFPREQRAIATFWSDGVGTYPPPGHWNYIAASEFAQLNFSEARWARNMALLNMSIMDAGVACWDAKYFITTPAHADGYTDKTDIGLPNFFAYISGHSTFSGAAATVLDYIISLQSTTVYWYGKETVSRMYGGIHYRSDCDMGIVTGNKLALMPLPEMPGRCRVKTFSARHFDIKCKLMKKFFAGNFPVQKPQPNRHHNKNIPPSALNPRQHHCLFITSTKIWLSNCRPSRAIYSQEKIWSNKSYFNPADIANKTGCAAWFAK